MDDRSPKISGKKADIIPLGTESPLQQQESREPLIFKKSLQAITTNAELKMGQSEANIGARIGMADPQTKIPNKTMIKQELPIRYQMPKNLSDITKRSFKNLLHNTTWDKELSIERSRSKNKSTARLLSGSQKLDGVQQSQKPVNPKTVLHLITSADRSEKTPGLLSHRTSPARIHKPGMGQNPNVGIVPYPSMMGYYHPMHTNPWAYQGEFAYPPGFSRDHGNYGPYYPYPPSNVFMQRSFQRQPTDEFAVEEMELDTSNRSWGRDGYQRQTMGGRMTNDGQTGARGVGSSMGITNPSGKSVPRTKLEELQNRMATLLERKTPVIQESQNQKQRFHSSISGYLAAGSIPKTPDNMRGGTRTVQGQFTDMSPISPSKTHLKEESGTAFEGSRGTVESQGFSPFATVFRQKDSSGRGYYSKDGLRPDNFAANLLSKHVSREKQDIDRKSYAGPNNQSGQSRKNILDLKERPSAGRGGGNVGPKTSTMIPNSPDTSQSHIGDGQFPSSRDNTSFFTKNQPVMQDSSLMTDLTARKIDDMDKQYTVMVESIGSEVRKVSDLNRTIRDYQNRITELEFEIRRMKSFKEEETQDGQLYGMNIYDPVDKLTEIGPGHSSPPPAPAAQDCSDYDFASMSSGNFTEKPRYPQPTILVSNSNVQILTSTPEKPHSEEEHRQSSGENSGNGKQSTKKRSASEAIPKENGPSMSELIACFDDNSALDEDFSDSCEAHGLDPTLAAFLLQKRQELRNLKETVVMVQHEQSLQPRK